MKHVETISLPHDLSEFTEIIDVRSPLEFAEDHLPDAVNLPVLNDEERAKVGLGRAQNMGPVTRHTLFSLPQAPAVGGLPRPGGHLIDLDARRLFLTENPEVSAAYCLNDISASPLSGRTPRVISVGPEGLEKGSVPDELPWYQSLAQSYSTQGDACLIGQDQACQGIVDNLQLFIDIWGLRPTIERTETAFEPLSAQANMALNSMINSYIVARHFSDVPPRQDEKIIDFLFGRVTNFKRVVRRDEALPAAWRYGHAAGQLSVLPVLSAGALIGDPNTFSEGIEFYALALENMRVDGSLREDSQAGDMALMEESATLSALLMTGLRAEQQGLDLFSTTVRGRDIHTLAHAVLNHLENWDGLMPYAKTEKDSFLSAVRLSHEPTSFFVRDLDHLIGWTVAYTERFPQSEVTQRIRSLTLDNRTCGRLTERHGKAPWTCFRALSSMSMGADTLLPSPSGTMFLGFNPGCLMATEVSPFRHHQARK